MPVRSNRSKAARSRKTATGRAPLTVFRRIGEMLTLQGAAEKQGRRIKVEDLTPIRNAALVEKQGRILWVGAEADLPREILKGQPVKKVDLQGATVVPAFIESHTHLIHSGNRSGEFERRNQGESYQSIAESGGGIRATVVPTREATEQQLAAIGQERVERFFRQGVGTIEVKSGYGLDVETEMKMLRAAGRLKKARIVRTFLGAHAVPREAKSAAEYVDLLIDKALAEIAAANLASRVDVFVERGYFDRDLASRYLLEARKLGFDLVVHADQLTRSGGAELAVEVQAISAEHLICINDSDIAKLARSEVTCALLPSSDLYMKCAYPPARKLIDQGARVALATDFNPGTSPSQDTALVGVLARIEMKMSLAEVIAAYTVGAAHALGLQNDLGSLSVGKSCDFVQLDGSASELFLEVGRQPVECLFLRGKSVF